MLWFKNNKENEINKEVEKLREQVDKLRIENNNINEKFTNSISQLHRIIKYSDDQPTYYLDVDNIGSLFSCKLIYNLYIYNDRKEYLINLSEIDNKSTDRETIDFRLDGDFVYFSISSRTILDLEFKKWTRHEFIIDFRNGKYVYTNKDDDEMNLKEKKITVE